MQVVPDTVVEEAAHRFAALLGDPIRPRIVRVLHELGGSTVGKIATAAGTWGANTSQHLGRLLLGGVAGLTRDGQVARYRITDDSVEQLCQIVCDSVAGRAIASGGRGTR